MAVTPGVGSAQWEYDRRKELVYEKPPAVPSDQAEHHLAAQWHVCAVCHESWLCHEHHAHGHPRCPGAPYVFRAPRKPWPADWPQEEDADATSEGV